MFFINIVVGMINSHANLFAWISIAEKKMLLFMLWSFSMFTDSVCYVVQYVQSRGR